VKHSNKLLKVYFLNKLTKEFHLIIILIYGQEIK